MEVCENLDQKQRLFVFSLFLERKRKLMSVSFHMQPLKRVDVLSSKPPLSWVGLSPAGRHPRQRKRKQNFAQKQK